MGVPLIVNKIRKKKLKQFRYVLRREDTEVVKLVKKIFIEGTRRRGKPKKRW